MTSNPPTQEEWKDLYEAARMFKELAPWKWMEDPDVFGVQEPGNRRNRLLLHYGCPR